MQWGTINKATLQSFLTDPQFSTCSCNCRDPLPGKSGYGEVRSRPRRKRNEMVLAKAFKQQLLHDSESDRYLAVPLDAGRRRW